MAFQGKSYLSESVANHLNGPAIVTYGCRVILGEVIDYTTTLKFIFYDRKAFTGLCLAGSRSQLVLFEIVKFPFVVKKENIFCLLSTV